ncbi:hypothetical protein D3C73_1218940 [compost metagenome]
MNPAPGGGIRCGRIRDDMKGRSRIRLRLLYAKRHMKNFHTVQMGPPLIIIREYLQHAELLTYLHQLEGSSADGPPAKSALRTGFHITRNNRCPAGAQERKKQLIRLPQNNAHRGRIQGLHPGNFLENGAVERPLRGLYQPLQ